MSPPSSLPSAKWVANHCWDKWNAVAPLDPALRDDIDGLAQYFYDNGLFGTFIDSMVPWNDLTGIPNQGHEAVADFLITRSARGALSSNFDPLIEVWAGNHKVAMRGALNGRDAVRQVTISNPLLKFHGCMQLDRERTVWTSAQFAESVIADRRKTCSDWINLNLPGCHLLVVGFWSDWDYLNAAFTASFTAVDAASVTVVNPEDSAALASKAPGLWNRLRSAGGPFEHVQESGDAFLTELRTAFSEAWVRKALRRAEAMLTPAPAPTTLALAASSPALSLSDLYDLRS